MKEYYMKKLKQIIIMMTNKDSQLMLLPDIITLKHIKKWK